MTDMSNETMSLATYEANRAQRTPVGEHPITQKVATTIVRVIENSPGYMLVESDCDGPMADGRMFRTPNDAKSYAHGVGWVVDERWNREVIL
jgi:hypothetical protein